MPEFRQDPISGRWVIIAEDRADRPSEYVNQPARYSIDRCPFCAGNEQDTPDAVVAYPGETETSGSWQVRVIPNRFPAATLDGAACSVQLRQQRIGDSIPTGPFDLVAQPGIGVHEVIIESPRHVASFTELTDEQARLALHAYRDRLLSLGQNPQLHYGLLFKNCRGAGGATLEHVHSQLLATGIVPPAVDQELRSATLHFDRTGQCLFCDLLRQELAGGVRIVAETSQLVAYCPFASRFPYEICILPRNHASRFERADSAVLAELAQLLQSLLGSFEEWFANAAYNFWIHTAPFHASCDERYHWHLEVIPRVTSQAGYEWGTGCFVNPVSPESAARRLRQFQCDRSDEDHLIRPSH